jgi:biotin carboxyl carrier protein
MAAEHSTRGGHVAEVCAEMVANVIQVVVGPSDVVAAGDTLLVLESMKMEIPVLAEQGGTVSEVKVHEGDVVQEGDVLVVLA